MAATAAQRAWAGNEYFIESQPPIQDADVTEFDREVKRLSLKPFELVSSIALRYWAKRYANRRYIPEWLLNAWAIRVNAENWE